MILNFIFSHLNAIVLGVWVLFLIIVAIRYFQPTWIRSNNKFLLKIFTGFKNISFLNLIFIAIGLNIFYGLFVTWGQYYVWVHGSAVTKALLTFPLPAAVPFSKYFEWIRPIFSNHLGYFMFYAWGRIWLDIVVLFIFSGLMYSVFRTWKFYRGGFLEKGPELMLVLMLISGWMGVLVSLSLGFIFAILWFSFSYSKPFLKKMYTSVSERLSKTIFKKIFPEIKFVESKINKIIAIEPVFIFATFFALIFTKIILSYF